MKSVTKYILASFLTVVVISTVFGLHSLKQYHDIEDRNENVRLETCLRTFWQLLGHKGTDFRIVNGTLRAGSYTVNGNFELPDRIQEIFGGVATIFMGDERVSTNVLNSEGQRALGTKLEGPAYEAIFRQEKSYRGAANILGVRYLTAYDPITDHSGKIIGALFVGVKESDILARMHVMRTQLTMTLFSMMMALTFIMVLLGLAMRRVEDAHENQAKFQRTLMDTIPNPIFYKDAACRYLGCNTAFEKYVGFSQSELNGKTPHELWPKELADHYRQQDLELLSHPGMQSYETSVLTADGTHRDVIFNKATFSGKDGTVAGLVAVILDITERKQAEAATENAYQQVLDIVEFLPDATFVVDKEKRVIAWNRAIEKMTGLKKEEVIGQGDYIYSIPFYGERRPILIDLIDEDVEIVKSKYAYINVEGRTMCAETYIPSFRNGDACYLWGTATPLFDRQGHQIGGIESIRDITAYKLAENEKIRLESQLAYTRLMETMMMRLGHDIKTPLTPLFILLALLKKQLSDPAQINKVDTCIKCAVSIKNLAEKTRILASLSSRTEGQSMESISLATIVDHALEECSEIMSRKQITGKNHVDRALVVHAISKQLHELFINLISNSVQFSNEQGVIEISAVQNDGTTTVAVQDEGVGIAPDHLNHVFDEFFKSDESRHDLETSGLGLSICKRVVQNHLGRIWAESPGLGKGTTIRFSLNERHAVRQHTGKKSLE